MQVLPLVVRLELVELQAREAARVARRADEVIRVLEPIVAACRLGGLGLGLGLRCRLGLRLGLGSGFGFGVVSGHVVSVVRDEG